MMGNKITQNKTAMGALLLLMVLHPAMAHGDRGGFVGRKGGTGRGQDKEKGEWGAQQQYNQTGEGAHGPGDGKEGRRPGMGIFVATNDGSSSQLTLLHSFEGTRDGSIVRAADNRIMAVFRTFSLESARGAAVNNNFSVSFSSNQGVNWTEPVNATITNLPSSIAAIGHPTLVQSSGQVTMYFSGASDRMIRNATTAVYEATWNGGSFEYKQKVFEMAGQVVWDIAATVKDGNTIMVMPDRMAGGKPGYSRDEPVEEQEELVVVEEDDDVGPTAILRHANGSGMAGQKPSEGKRPTISQGKGFLTTNFGTPINVTLPGNGGSWDGSLAVDNASGDLYFFGTGRASWPAVSRDLSTWLSPEEAGITAITVPGKTSGAVQLDNNNWLFASAKHGRGRH